MKVLFSTTSGAGHWVPLLPVADALIEEGHSVLFACPDTSATALRDRRLDVSPFDEVEGRTPEQVELFSQTAESGDPMFAERAVALGFGYHSPNAALPRLTGTWERFEPDVLVRDPGEFASSVLAEATGTPSVIGVGGLLSALAFVMALVASPLERLRSEHGLPERAPGAGERLTLTATPPTFDDTDGWVGGVRRYSLGRPHVPPPEGLPVVYATLGTEVIRQGDLGPRLVQLISDAIAMLDEVRCVLTVGADPSTLGPVHERVELRAFADHADIIPAARVVVSHGGAGTIQDAIHMGRPMAVLPQFADQFQNGARVDALGLGRCLSPPDQTPDLLAAAVTTALEGRFDAEADRIANEASALPPAHSCIAELESLVEQRR